MLDLTGPETAHPCPDSSSPSVLVQSTIGWFKATNASEVGRDPQAAANVCAEAEDGSSASDQSGLSTRGSSRCSAVIVGVEGVAVHRDTTAPGDHGLGDVGQTEWHGVMLLHSNHEAAVPGGGAVDELGQAHGAVVARDVETLLVMTELVTAVTLQATLMSSPSQRRAGRTELLSQSRGPPPAGGPSPEPPG